MQERLSFLLQQLNLTPAQFAEKLRINRATVSHLLSGRNKPSMTLVEDLLRQFTNVNPDWLILGRGSWERSSQPSSPQLKLEPETPAQIPAPTPEVVRPVEPGPPSTPPPVIPQTQTSTPQDNSNNPVVKMILIRKDGSIEEYGRG